MLRSVAVARASISLTMRRLLRDVQMLTARLSSPHAGGDALADERGLQLGHRADDGEHRPPHRTVGVDLILNADEADAEMVEFFQGHQQMARASREAIEFPDQHAVDLAVSGGRHQAVELGAALLAA